MPREIWGFAQGIRSQYLTETDRFTGDQLRGINYRVSTFLEQHPGTTRDQAVEALTRHPRETAQMQSALDVINQLDVAGAPFNNIHSVTVRQAPSTKIPEGRSGHGTPHVSFEIDWVKMPRRSSNESGPTPQPLTPEQRTAKNREKRQRQKERERERKAQERAKQEKFSHVLFFCKFQIISHKRSDICIKTTEFQNLK